MCLCVRDRLALTNQSPCCHLQCRDALTTRQKLIVQDYKVSYSLAKACKSDLRKYRCNADANLPRAREARLSFLLLCLESAVHRGQCVSRSLAHGQAGGGADGRDAVTAQWADLGVSCGSATGRVVSGECQGEMMDYRRMLMEDFSLSPEIVLHCRSEIETQCSGLHRKGRTLHCLMRVGRGDKGVVEEMCQRSVSNPPSPHYSFSHLHSY